MNRYAIVDIETTGGFASRNRIIEIAVVVTDGVEVLDRFESLIDPGMPIPAYITGLTGIDDAAVEKAPSFDNLAPVIYEKLDGCTFVAHNVNFDYSFVKNEFQLSGYDFNPRKLCTVRLSRKVFPGYKSYSLGNLCGFLNIPIENRHRAMGDAFATYELLKRILANDGVKEIEKSVKRNSFEQTLPPNLPREQFENLPSKAGVYYFHDENGKIIYVGKAINIRKRISSHFTGNIKSPQRQNFLRDIHSISTEVTGNELVALLLETNEIHHYWPKYNRAQKHQEQHYGIFSYTGQDGFIRLAIDKLNKHTKPELHFDSLAKANEHMLHVIREYELCLAKCTIGTGGKITEACRETCQCHKGARSYNKKVSKALLAPVSEMPDYAVVAPGRSEEEISFILVKDGRYSGYGFTENVPVTWDRLEELIQPRKHYRFATSIIESFVNQGNSEYTLLPRQQVKTK